MATRLEVQSTIAFLIEGSGAKDGPSAAAVDIWCELLADIPADELRRAAQTVVIENQYPVMPTVGRVRQAALALRPPAVCASETWPLVLAAVRRFGLSGARKALAGLPGPAARAAAPLWEGICNSDDAGLPFRLKEFCELYDSHAQHEERLAALPKGLSQGVGEMPDARHKARGQLGRFVPPALE